MVDLFKFAKENNVQIKIVCVDNCYELTLSRGIHQMRDMLSDDVVKNDEPLEYVLDRDLTILNREEEGHRKLIEDYNKRAIKPRAIYQGFSSHDCESWYKCPVCGETFGSWSLSGQAKNENGTDKYCPHCKTELRGLD